MIAMRTRPVVYQSPVNKIDNLNKEEKTVDSDELSFERKFSLNKTSLLNEKSSEPEFGKKENPLDFSSKLDSVKRISQFFEKDVSGECVSLESVTKVDKLYRKPKDAASASVLREKIKAYEIQIKNRVDNPTKALVKRKSENQLKNVSPKKTNESNLEVNIALIRTKRLPSIVIDESIRKENEYPESELIKQKDDRKNSIYKHLDFTNKIQTNGIKDTTDDDHQIITNIDNGKEPKWNDRKDTQENRIIYDNISSVKLSITKYQQNITNSNSLPKQNKANKIQERDLNIENTNMNKINSRSFNEDSHLQRSNNVIIIEPLESPNKANNLKEKSQNVKNMNTIIDLPNMGTIIQQNDDSLLAEDEIDISLEKNNKSSTDFSEGSVKLIITKYQENIKNKLEKKKNNKENVTSVKKGRKQNAQKSVRKTVIEKPLTIELIQVDNATADQDVKTFTEVKKFNSSRKQSESSRNVPIIINEEKKNANIADQDSATNLIPNLTEVEKAPSSSIKNIVKQARITVDIEKLEVSNQIKDSKPKPKTFSTTKLNTQKNTENLSFKEELARTLLRKYNTENGEEKPSTERALKDFEVKGKLKQTESEDVNNENTLVFKYQIGKKSKEEEMTDWIAVDDVVIKTKEELEIEKRQNEKKNVSNKFRSDVEKNNIQSKEKSKDQKLPNKTKKEDRNNNESNYQNIEDVPPDYDIDDGNDNKGNDNSQLESFIAKHVEKQMKQSKMSSKGKNSGKQRATRMRSHNRPNVSEYFKENDSKIIPNGPISSAGNDPELPVPDYDY